MTLNKKIELSLKTREKYLNRKTEAVNKTKKFEEYAAICTLDFGMNQLTKRVSSGLDDDVVEVEVIRGSSSKLFDSMAGTMRKLPTGSLITGEDSHIGTMRTDLSLSQPFTDDQLEFLYDLAEELGHHLRLLPQKSAPKVIAFTQELFPDGAWKDSSKTEKVEIEKSDSIDPFSWHTFLKHHPEVLAASKHPTKVWEYTDAEKAGHKMLKYLNRDANLARAYLNDDGDKGAYTDETDVIIPFLKNVFFPHLAANLTKRQLSVIVKNVDKLYYGSGSKKWGYKKGDINWNQVNVVQLYSMCLTVMERNGDPRLAGHTGNIPGRRFILDKILKAKAFHFRGGVIRSSQKHWGFKPWVKAECFVDRGEHKVPSLDKDGNPVLTPKGKPKKVKVLKDPNIDLTRKVKVKNNEGKLESKTVSPGRFNAAETAFFKKNRSFYDLTWIQCRQIAKSLYLEHFAEQHESCREKFVYDLQNAN